jgi:hypothetical protein
LVPTATLEVNGKERMIVAPAVSVELVRPCYTGLVAGAGIRLGELYGKSDETGSSPKENPVHPTDLLATIYYALGIDPGQMVLNDLGQQRELVTGTPLAELFS